MGRSLRQTKILELIEQNPIETQEELVDALNLNLFKVTQATVSRDIKELGLIKVPNGDRYRYSYIDNDRQKLSTKLINLFREAVVSIAHSGNLIVIRTLSGSANAAGMAVDKLALSSILGCVAGDDTVLLIVRTEEEVAETLSLLNDFID
jgi:transcriptional regulator of arginine metabolism